MAASFPVSKFQVRFANAVGIAVDQYDTYASLAARIEAAGYEIRVNHIAAKKLTDAELVAACRAFHMPDHDAF